MGRQYTVFETVHPVLLLVYAMAAPLLAMCTNRPGYLLVSLAGACLLYGFYFGPKAAGKCLLRMLPLALLTAIINFCFQTRGMHTLFRIGSHPFTLESLVYGFCNGLMLISVIIWFQCFPAIVSNDKFLYVFGQRLPGTALLLSMILRLFPDTRYRMRSIQYADKEPVTREKPPLRKRMKKGLRQISALLEWSMEDSIEMADSMKARGYGKGVRTSYQRYPFTKSDLGIGIWFFLTIGGAAYGMLYLKTQLRWYPVIWIGGSRKVEILSLLGYMLFLGTPVWEEWKGWWRR